MATSLHVVLSTHDLDAAHTGTSGNAPEERKQLVHQRLLSHSDKPTFVNVATPATTFDAARVVHDEGLLEFYATGWPKWVAALTAKPTNVHLIDFALLENHGERLFTAEGELSGKAPPMIAAYAAPRHDGLQRPTRGVLGQICYYCMDRETPLTASTALSLLWDLSVALEATRIVVSREARIAYALVTHPGHHAGKSSYGGFCFINSAAIAVKQLQAKYDKVAVIDVDYHAGNGTQQIFNNDPTVFFVSLHSDPEFEYPFNCGFADQKGGPDALGTTMCVPLRGGTVWSDYKVHLQAVIDAVRAFGAQALVISLGLDTMHGDIVAYPHAAFQLHPSDFAEMGAMLLGRRNGLECNDGHLAGLELPTVVIQEGGYDLTQVPEAIAQFLTGKP